MRKGIWILWIFSFLCGVEPDFKLKIGVSIPAEKYFLQKIGGNFVDVIAFVPPARNPRLYTPTSDQVKMVKNLHAYIGVGLPFEKRWLKRFANANPSLRILELVDLDCREKICFSWFSFQNAREYSKKIAYVLRALDIKNAKIYKENLELFLQELDELEKQIAQKFASSKSQKKFGTVAGGWREYAKNFSLQALDISNPQELQIFRESKLSVVFITPFNLKKQVLSVLPKAKLVEIDPFSAQWKENLLKITAYILGE